MSGRYHPGYILGVIGTCATLAITFMLTIPTHGRLEPFSATYVDRYGGEFTLHLRDITDHVQKVLAIVDVDVFSPRSLEGASESLAERAYASHSQPGQSWRVAADAYRHIDPGRRLMI